MQARTSMSQMVQVVSMLDVPKRFKSDSFQSNDVSGAQNSLFLFCIQIEKVYISTPHVPRPYLARAYSQATNMGQHLPVMCTHI